MVFLNICPFFSELGLNLNSVFPIPGDQSADHWFYFLWDRHIHEHIKYHCTRRFKQIPHPSQCKSFSWGGSSIFQEPRKKERTNNDVDANRVNTDSIHFACRCTEWILEKQWYVQDTQRDTLQQPKGNRKTPRVSAFCVYHIVSLLTQLLENLLSVPRLS